MAKKYLVTNEKSEKFFLGSSVGSRYNVGRHFKKCKNICMCKSIIMFLQKGLSSGEISFVGLKVDGG